MKLKSATALVVSSVTLFVASLAVAQNPPRQGGAEPAGRPTLPVARPVGLPGGLPPGAAIQVTPATPTGSGRPATAPPATAPAGGPGAGPTRPPTPPPTRPGAAGAGPTTPGAPGASTTLREFESNIDYQPIPPGARITFNLQDADLPDLIRAIGNLTGKRFILPGKLRSIKTTIYSPTKVTSGEAYQAFLSTLIANGLTVVPSGQYFVVQETANSAQSPLPTYATGEGTPRTEQYITRIHRLRNMSAEDAVSLLGHFKSRDGDITPYPATNTVMITDTGANIRRMMQILAEVDVPGVGEQIWVERIHYAPATELATRITELLGGAASGAPRPAGGPGAAAAAASETRLTRISPDERTNSLIIVATERMYLRVLELIRRLDVPIEGEGEVHVQYLQHADAAELSETLNQITGTAGGRPGGAAPAGGAGASRGPNTTVFEAPLRITADKRTNALVITSSPRDYASIRRVISELDRARRQVFIEAVVMELSATNRLNLGVSWHGGAEPGTDSLAVGGFRSTASGQQGAGSLGFPLSLLSATEAAQGLALGIRGPNLNTTIAGVSVPIPSVAAVLTAVAQAGDSDILATPSIIATDNTPALINVGQNVPTQINSGSSFPSIPGVGGAAGSTAGLFPGFAGGFTAPRENVGLKISVTPHINDSNEVRMDIEEEMSELGEPLGGTLGAFPINKRNAKTTVVVQDQQTIVIGGLVRNTTVRTNTRVPILGDLPLIGVLFRQESRQTERRNLLLFMTPYVIRDQSDLRRIFERKMRERQEFLDRYFVFSASDDFHPVIDYTRTNGMVEEVRQAIREMRVQSEIEARAVPRPAPPHTVSEPIELPAELRLGPDTSSSAPTPRAPPMAVPSDARPAAGLPLAVPVGASPGALPTGPPPSAAPAP